MSPLGPVDCTAGAFCFWRIPGDYTRRSGYKLEKLLVPDHQTPPSARAWHAVLTVLTHAYR